MSKTQFKFNPHTLEYEEDRSGYKNGVKIALLTLVFGSIFTTLGILLFIENVDSPKEAELKDEINMWKIEYDHLNDKLAVLENKSADNALKDEQVYRSILGAEPLKEEVRQAGIGGSNPYESLRGKENSDLIVATHKRMDELKAKLEIQNKSLSYLAEEAKKRQELLKCIPAIQPISNVKLKRIASGFGWRKHPKYKVKKFHKGLDFAAKTGTEIYSTGDGKVVKVSKRRTGYGYHVIIDHGFGYKTLYAHMSKFNVTKGQTVKRGEIIGYVGNTGTSTAPHLHYEVIKDERKINPINFFYNDLTPEQYEEMRNISSQPSQSLD